MRTMRYAMSLGLLAVVGAGPSVAAPTPVSPGADGGSALIGTACPTFSWGGVGAGERVELVVYRADEAGVGSSPVLRRSLPEGTSSWTPSLGECLEAGGSYAWAVRAPGLDRAGGEWSEAQLFEVSAAPSAEELERALAVIAAYSQGAGAAVNSATSGTARAVEAPSRNASERTAAETVVDIVGEGGVTEGSGGGTTAIAGVVSDTTGQNVGVHGSVASGDLGVGVMAVSTATSGIGFGLVASTAAPIGSALLVGADNGADLVTTSSPFGVDGAGNVEATSFTGDGSGLTGVPVAADTVATAQIVDGGIAFTDLASTAVRSQNIQNFGIATVDLANDAVTPEKIQDGAVRNAKLWPDAVTSDKIADGTITAADLGSGSVTSGAIVDGHVGTAALADNAVTGAKVLNGSIGTTDMGFRGYWSKSDVYEVVDQETITGSGFAFLQVFCQDVDDLPIGASCGDNSSSSSDGSGRIVEWDLISWDTSGASSAKCTYRRTSTSGSLVAQVRILCVDVD